MPRNPDRNLGLLAVVILVAAIGFGGITLRASAESQWQGAEENTPTPTGTLEPEASASPTPLSTGTESPDDAASPTPTPTSTNPPTETVESSPTASPTAVEPSPEPTATTPWYEGLVTPTPMPTEEDLAQSSFGPQSFSTASESTDLIVDDGPEDVYRPQVAFNPDAGVYLVVWQSNEDQDQTDVFARYLQSDGQPLTSTITLLENVQGSVRTRVAYGGGTFLLVYREGSDRAAADLYSVALNGNPDPTPALSAPQHVHSPVGRKFTVAFRDAPGEEEFVVVFLDAAHPVLSDFGRGEIFGRRVSTSGQVVAVTEKIIERTDVGSVHAVLNSPAFQIDLSLAYNPERDDFYLTWGIYDCTTASCVDREDIWAQLIDGPSLSPAGRLWFITANTPGIQWYQRIAYHAELQRYLIVWADNRNSELEFDLFRQPVNQFGVPQGDDLVLIGEPGSQRFPEIAAIPAGEAIPPFVVVYQDEPVGGGDVAHGARVNDSGHLLRPPFPLSDDGNSLQSMPSLAVRPGNPSEWLAAWAHGRSLGDRDLHGRITVESGPMVEVVGPRDWTMVLSLRPTLRWNEFPDAARYRLTVRSFSEAGTAEEITSVELASSSRDPENEGEHRWKIDVDLSSGTTLEDAGYEWTVQALDDAGNPLATSEIGTFQIPPLGVDPANPEWNQFDDLIYRWSEARDLPPALVKALLAKEQGEDLRDHRNGDPAERAYLYEPTWDYDNCILGGNGNTCNDPRLSDYHQPDAASEILPRSVGAVNGMAWSANPTIADVAADPKPVSAQFLGRSISNFRALERKTNCRLLDLISTSAARRFYNCVVDWFGGDPPVAQYRIMASYGLGQVTYWQNFKEPALDPFEPRAGAAAAPEDLYDPELNLNLSTTILSHKRCAWQRAAGVEVEDPIAEPNEFLNASHYRDEDFIRWRQVLPAYNGPEFQYPQRIAAEDYVTAVSLRFFGGQNKPGSRPVDLTGTGAEVQIEASPPQTFQGLGDSEPRPCPLPESEVGGEGGVSLVTMVLSDPLELLAHPVTSVTLSELSLDFEGDGDPEWVVVDWLGDPDVHVLHSAVARIYGDQDRNDLLWESPVIEDVKTHMSAVAHQHPASGRDILQVEWYVGAHGSRTYFVHEGEEDFGFIPIIDANGSSFDHTVSDGGGAFLLPDGSLAVLQRGAERSLVQTTTTILAFRDGAYHEARRYLFDPVVEDTDPPQTEVIVTPPANQAGWHKSPAVLSLSAEDDHAVDSIRFTLTNAEVTEHKVSALTDISVPLAEGRWTIGYSALDIYGNEEVEKVLETFIDGTAPATEIQLGGTEGNQGWFISPVEVVLAAADPDLADGSSGSGVSKVEYSLEEGTSWKTYEEPFDVIEEGTTTVHYRAVDIAGNVEKVDSIDINIDTIPPEAAIEAEPTELWPPNHKPVIVSVEGSAVDETSGLDLASFQILDEYGQWQPELQDVIFDGEKTGAWEFEVEFIAARKGNDKDGRVYTIRALVFDLAGNRSAVEVTVIVPHDQRESQGGPAGP